MSKGGMKCAICESLTPWQNTELPHLEGVLRDLPSFSTNGEGWTSNFSSTWACSRCIHRGRALKGDPTKQNSPGYSPTFFAYWDRERRCKHCGASYIFEAGEQRFWYETMGFHTESVPTGCRECRRILRRRKHANRLVAETLSAMDHQDWQQLAELAELYVRVGSKKKAIETLRRAKNLCATESGRDALLKRVDEVKKLKLPTAPREQFAKFARLRGWANCSPESVKRWTEEAAPILSDEGRKLAEELVAEWRQERYGSTE